MHSKAGTLQAFEVERTEIKSVDDRLEGLSMKPEEGVE